VTVQGAGGFMGGTLRWRDACGGGLRPAAGRTTGERFAAVRATIIGQDAPGRRKARALCLALAPLKAVAFARNARREIIGGRALCLRIRARFEQSNQIAPMSQFRFLGGTRWMRVDVFNKGNATLA
jgi:hypothetical protein